ncbi:MAG: alpha/beta hydrolase [Actinomycetota bacterium]
MTFLETVHLQHNRVTLALHKIREGSGRPLLLLHGLGEDAARVAATDPAWAGPVWALDFTGHGRSTVPRGGGYSCEILMADVDFALGHIGEATILGRGLGAYVAFLIAGARPQLVRGAVLTDGPGLSGGPVHVSSSPEIVEIDRPGLAPDPWALIELSRDARPATYALTFAKLAVNGSGLDDPIAVCCRVTPPWLEAINAEPGVATGLSVTEALEMYAAL